MKGSRREHRGQCGGLRPRRWAADDHPRCRHRCRVACLLVLYRRSAAATAAGILSGTLTWGVAASVGAAALLAASKAGYTAGAPRGSRLPALPGRLHAAPQFAPRNGPCSDAARFARPVAGVAARVRRQHPQPEGRRVLRGADPQFIHRTHRTSRWACCLPSYTTSRALYSSPRSSRGRMRPPVSRPPGRPPPDRAHHRYGARRVRPADRARRLVGPSSS